MGPECQMKSETKEAPAMASNNNNGKEKKEVMQSNLPLLFANGSPISLESMNLSELQRFLLFLLKCECGRPLNSLSDLDPPGWWPPEVAFEDELLGKSSKKGMWSSVLRKLILKCYEHHSSSFLLEFSRKLMIATQDSNKIKVLDNGDGTRSMRSAVSDKLLVTFRSENQDYDKKQRQQFNSFSTQSPLKKRCSLSLGINASDPRLPRCEDLYLCDNCGASFKSLPTVLDHEKTCQEAVDTKKAEESDQRFFHYLKLSGSHSSNSSSSSSKVVRPKPSTYAKFLSIDVCSPLGQYIYSLSSNTNDEIDISTLCMAERKSALRSVVPHSNTCSEKVFSKSIYYPPLVVGGHGEEYPVTYRGNRLRNLRKQDPHILCFNRQQKAVKRFTLQYGMSPRAMKLYKEVRKRRVQVSLKPMDVKKISEILKGLESSHRDERKRAKMQLLKEQARHFQPFVPKLTSAYQLSKQSSYSVLKSFTSAVQQLCSPEKAPKSVSKQSHQLQQLMNNHNLTVIPPSTPVVTNNQIIVPSAPKVPGSIPVQAPSQPQVANGGSKLTVTSGGKPQCIDLCSSSDDEVELRNIQR